MPLYAYECPKCNAQEEIFLPLSRYAEAQPCPACGAPLTKQLSLARIQPDYAPYSCPITGKLIAGRKAHRANLARHGCRVAEGGEKEAAQRRAAQAEASLDALCETAAIEGVNSLPERKLQTLAAELEKGAEVLQIRL